MIETISLRPGITLRACRDTRFKQGDKSGSMKGSAGQLETQTNKAEFCTNHSGQTGPLAQLYWLDWFLNPHCRQTSA